MAVATDIDLRRERAAEFNRCYLIAARLIAAPPGLHKLWKGATLKYKGPGLPITVAPERPAAAVLFNRATRRKAARARTLVCDFDAKARDGAPPAEIQRLRDAAERDAWRAYALFERLGAYPVIDHAPTSGGWHIYIRVPAGEEFTVAEIKPIMRAMQRRYPSLDTMPMSGDGGCITVPGSRVKDGGFRELVGADIRDLIERLTLGADSGFLARLTAELEPQLSLDSLIDDDLDDLEQTDAPAPRATSADVLADLGLSGLDLTSTLPVELRSQLPLLRGWAKAFVATGTCPPFKDRKGNNWTPSHARQSLLSRMARCGWSGDKAFAAVANQWPAVWVNHAHKTPHQQATLFRDEWTKAFSEAVEHAHRRKDRTSATTGHKVDPKAHRGVPPNPAKARLAAAQVWVLTSPDLPPQLQRSALLTLQGLAHALSVSRSPTAVFGVRGLGLACGLPAETVRRTLVRLRSIPGSPVSLVNRTNLSAQTQMHVAGSGRAGDEYTLVTPLLDGRPVVARWWEVDAARLDAVDPAWSTVGHPMAWWVWRTMLALDRGDRTAPLPLRVVAAAARISVDTVEKAIAALADEGLVNYTYGHAVRTSRTVRQLGERTEIADELHEQRRDRYVQERAEFVAFLTIITEEYGPDAAVLVAAADVVRAAEPEDLADWAAWTADVDDRAPPDRVWCSEHANLRSIELLRHRYDVTDEDAAYTEALQFCLDTPAVPDWSEDVEHDRALRLVTAFATIVAVGN